MVDQEALAVAHPYRVLVPVLSFSLIAERSPATAHNLGLIRGRDQVVPYMYLPPLPGVLNEESVACLHRPTTVSDAFLRDPPRRVAQLHPEARRQLKIKLARYWARSSPSRDQIDLLEMDEESVRSTDAPPSAYDIPTRLPAGPNVLLTVRGHKSGLPRTVPVSLLDLGDRCLLQAASADVGWVRNLRAAGEAVIASRGRSRDC